MTDAQANRLISKVTRLEKKIDQLLSEKTEPAEYMPLRKACELTGLSINEIRGRVERNPGVPIRKPMTKDGKKFSYNIKLLKQCA